MTNGCAPSGASLRPGAKRAFTPSRPRAGGNSMKRSAVGQSSQRRSEKLFDSRSIPMPVFIKRLLNVFRGGQLEDDVREEVETHLALIEDEERANGVTSGIARRNARLRFGNPAVYREQMRDANLATWLENLCQDL